MIPRRLPNLAADAIRNGWGMTITNDGTTVAAAFVKHGPHRTDVVLIEWYSAAIRAASINGTPTPYADCVRLIKEDQ